MTAILCPCGSGLREDRCCALDAAAIPPPETARQFIPIVERALQAHRAGDLATAESLCVEVLNQAPDRPGALAILLDIRRAQGNIQAAKALARRLVTLDPNNFRATNDLTLLLLGRGELAEAEVHARNAVRIAPENAQAHNLMGMVMTEAQRPAIGEFHYRRVLDLSGARDPILLANLAWCLKNQGRMEESRALYRESVEAAPTIPQTLLGWARMEEADRAFDAALDILARLEALAPGDPNVALNRAIVLGRLGRYDEAITLLDGIGQLGPNELLEKGRLLDRMGRHDAAFDAFLDGKRLARELSGNAYLDAAAAEQSARLKGFFTADRLRILPKASIRADVPQPIFILGFPRSGTTLVEQTLTAHSRVAAGDELPLINDITNIMPRMLASPLAYPEALAELWMGDRHEGLDDLRDYYLAKVRQMGILRDGADFFTDKMPLNETHLGLIALLFPAAPLIHVIRHPLDIMVSAMSNHFTHGLFCASALETAARHLVRVMDLVAYYRSQMALRYLPLRYEDMVTDQEDTVRDLLAFTGLDFEPGCLAFHENRRYARTASYAQVTERLYDRSRFRYRHYIRQLEPAIAILQPLIDQLGYTVEA